MESKVLKNEEVLRVQYLDERTFGDEVVLADGTKRANKLAGKPYWLFSFGGTVFTSHNADFREALKDGEVCELEYGLEDERIQLLSFITWKQKTNMKRKMVEYDSITVENFKPSSVGELEGLA